MKNISHQKQCLIATKRVSFGNRCQLICRITANLLRPCYFISCNADEGAQVETFTGRAENLRAMKIVKSSLSFHWKSNKKAWENEKYLQDGSDTFLSLLLKFSINETIWIARHFSTRQLRNIDHV